MEENQPKRGRGRPRKVEQEYKHVKIDFSQIGKLNTLELDPRMLEIMSTDTVLDKLISHEGGLPCATNLMFGGDPGVGKTTILLDYIASLQNVGRKCLFISAEMGRVQMFKYTKRFPQFGIVETLFVSDYLDYSVKDVIEQILDEGYDAVLVDSAAEILASVRDEMDWDKKKAEGWLVKLCVKHNKGLNIANKYTSFLMIQQLNISNGEFVGGNKLKYLFDGACKMLREKDGSTYIEFSKNRNGMTDVKLFFQLTGTQIIYTNIEAKVEEEVIDGGSTTT